MSEEAEQKIEGKKIAEADASEIKEVSKEKSAEVGNGVEQIKPRTNENQSDEYAEVPEKVLDEAELKELKEMKEEVEKKVNGRNDKKPARRGRNQAPTREEITAAWEPITKLGREVKNGKVKNIDDLLDSGQKILESEIVDSLLNLKSDLIAIGQAKGKFGGGKRRAWRQTQRKTKEGNIPTFSTMAVVGDENGHIGIGSGKSKETLPARDKAIRKAKLNIMKVKRTCAGFDCACSELHSVPFKVTGKSGSVKVTLIPAPQGTGLVVGNQLKKILKLAGIKDVYSQTFGKKRTTFNLIKACMDALEKTNSREVGR